MVAKKGKNRRRVDAAEQPPVAMRWRTFYQRSWRYAAATAILALLAIGGRAGWGYLTTTPRLALAHIEVVGAQRAPAGDLLERARLVRGLNLVTLNTWDVERDMASNPWVKSVRIERHWPNRLRVNVVEHRPIALVALGDLYVVNAEGELSKRLEADDTVDVPLLTGFERDAFVRHADEAGRTLKEAALLLALYQSRFPPDAAVSELRFREGGFDLVTVRGVELTLGRGDYETKLARLTQTLDVLKRRGHTAGVVRLDNQSRPGWVTVQLRSRPLGAQSLDRQPLASLHPDSRGTYGQE